MTRREQLMAAAVQVFADRGFEAATVDQVAVAAGVSVGTLYNYFASKEDILRSLVLQEFETRRGFLPRGHEVCTAREAIITLTRKHLNHVLSAPSASLVIMQEKRLIHHWQDLGMLPRQGMATLFQEVLARERSAVDAETIALMLQGAVEGLTMHLLRSSEKGILYDVEKLTTLFRNLIEQGLE